MRLPRTVAACLASLAIAACGGDDDATTSGASAEVKVMTRNLYLGAEINQLVTATTPEAIPAAVLAFWRQVQASNIPARMRLIAEEIDRERPHLVGLQEVERFRTQTPGDFDFAAAAAAGANRRASLNAETDAFDFLKLLTDELAARGARYRVVATGTYTDAELRSAPEMGGQTGRDFDLRMTDRDVILAREDVVTAAPQEKQFMSFVPLRVPLAAMPSVPVDLLRGYTSVEATVDGARFTFVNSHLEVGGDGRLALFQEAQADQLLQALAPVKGPLVLVGDFNSPATGSGTRSYARLTSGHTDAWTGADGPGLTCCSGVGGESFTPGSRIDLVLFRGGVTAKSAAVVGTDPEKRRTAGVWPSDHAGVVATLAIPR